MYAHPGGRIEMPRDAPVEDHQQHCVQRERDDLRYAHARHRVGGRHVGPPQVPDVERHAADGGGRDQGDERGGDLGQEGPHEV